MRRHGSTVLEIFIVAALFLLIIVLLYRFTSGMYARGKPSVAQKTGQSFIRQEIRLSFQRLMSRLDEGTEILAPAPGSSGPELLFRDILNHRIRLALNAKGELTTFRSASTGWEEETEPFRLQSDQGNVVTPSRPIRIPACKKVVFSVRTPTLAQVTLTLTDPANSTLVGHLVATACLRNAGLLEL